ncbi:MAG: 4Fe-4S cluster-binding domain-containing protein [Clostridia bacterium]|nr:4Fe-4S cluster-binding domain-containing protein [Clostridia bacterium]
MKTVICNICPRSCSAKREEKAGVCGVGEKFRVARAAPHFWEEPCLSGTRGSGTVFFSGCNLGCVYCQNQQISHGAFGKDVSSDGLKRIFDRLLESGVHNLNLVTPTHFVPMLAKTLAEYKSPVPIVYNSSGYEKAETLKMLEGLVDIYLPDIKYFDSAPALKYSGAADYFEYASKAVLEMHRQVGETVLDADGIARRGLIIRHMVLPGNISQAIKVFEWVRENLPAETYISVMRQYTPFGKAKEMPPIDRKLSSREYSLVKQKILAMGFENCNFQSGEAATESFIPNFDLEGVDL